MHILEPRSIRFAASFAILFSLQAGALAQTYTAKAGTSVAGNESSSIAAVPTETFWDENGTAWYRNAFSRAERGSLHAKPYCATYAKYNMAGYGIAELEYDDVIFTSAGSAPIQVDLNLTIDGNASVVNGNSAGVTVRVGTQVIGTATLVGSGAVTTTSGLSGWNMQSAFSLVHTLTVPVNTPVSLKLHLTDFAAGSSGGHIANAHHTLRLGGLSPLPGPCAQYSVFNLPAGVTVDSVQAGIAGNVWSPDPASASSINYCTAGTTASGCSAALSSTGAPSATSSSGFEVHATGVEGAKDGLFFFAENGRQANSWGNGTSFQCVAPPVKRAPLMTGTGTPGACDGSFCLDFSAFLATHPAKNPGPAAVVQLQCWFRDPQSTSNQTTSLSDAIEFVLAP